MLFQRRVVIPANAEALYNSEAGQSSLNTLCEAHKTFLLCASHVILHWIPAFAGMTGMGSLEAETSLSSEHWG